MRSGKQESSGILPPRRPERSTERARAADPAALVRESIDRPGRSLGARARSVMEARLGRSFAHVRVHTDATAARSAAAVDAAAYTVGHDVVFGSGAYSPETRAGRALLRHELSHVTPASAPRSGRPVEFDGPDGAAEAAASRSELGAASRNAVANADPARLHKKGGTPGGFFANAGRAIASFFSGSEIRYDEPTLRAYLALLRSQSDIEDDFDSDDKARAVVRQHLYVDEPLTIRILLVKEMLSGVCGDDDEQAILQILYAASAPDRKAIVDGVTAKRLRDKFDGGELEQLQALLKEPSSAAPKPLEVELQELIAQATWPKMRERLYPKESVAGRARSRERHEGRRADLTGLGRLSALEHFAVLMKEIQRKWPRRQRLERRTDIKEAANDELKKAKLPSLTDVGEEEMSSQAFFNAGNWTMVLSSATLSLPSLDDERAADLANTTLHESRHSEEIFLSARYAAGILRQRAPQIAREQHIPERPIAEEAVAHKFDSSTPPAEMSLGAAVYDRSIRHRAEHQALEGTDDIDELNRRRGEAVAALERLKRERTPEASQDALAKRKALLDQMAEVERRYTLYRADPIEADAHEVGDAEELAFRGWPARD